MVDSVSHRDRNYCRFDLGDGVHNAIRGKDVGARLGGWFHTAFYRRFQTLAGASDAAIRTIMTSTKHEIIIHGNDEDGVFIVDVSELPGCQAHGSSQELALKNAKAAIDLWLATASELKRPIPQPKGRRLLFA